MAKTENYLRQFNIVFWANRRLILLITVLFAAIAVIIAFFYPPVYTVTGTVNLKMKTVPSPPEDVNRPSEAAMVLPPERSDMVLETTIFKSRDVVRAAVQELVNKGVDLGRKPAKLNFLAPNGKVAEGSTDEEKVDHWTATVMGHIATNIEPGSSNFDIAFTYYTPKTAALILDALLMNYVQARQLLLNPGSSPAFYERQVRHFREEIDRLEKEKLDTLAKYRIADFQKEIDVQMDLIRVFTEEQAAAEDLYEGKKRDAEFLVAVLKRYGELDEPMYQPFPHDFQDREITNMNERLNTLLYEFSELRKVYRDDAPKVREASAQIENLWQKMMVMVRNRVEFEKTQMENQKQVVGRKKAKLDQLVKRNEELTTGWARLQRLEKDIELTQENYAVFSKKYEQARISENEKDNMIANVQIINRPVVPDAPTFPKPSVVIPVGVITGFLLGFALAYIREFFDHTFKVPAEVVEHLNVPVIGSVPYKRWF